MPPYQAFSLYDWIHRYAPTCKVSLHDSTVKPYTLSELQSLDPSHPIIAFDKSLTYANPRGTLELRGNIAQLYAPLGKDAKNASKLSSDDVLVTSGATAANYLILSSLLSRGDKIIAQHPTYNPLIEVPRRVGAEVHLWRQVASTADNNDSSDKSDSSDSSSDSDHSEHNDSGTPCFRLYIADLEKQMESLKPKMLVLNNPSNPTGAVLDAKQLREIADLCERHDVMILCDEVFRFLHHDQGAAASLAEERSMSASSSASAPPSPPPSMLELNPPPKKCLVTSGISKAFALPGIRVGWVAISPDLRETNVLDQLKWMSDYTAIAVGLVDQDIASFVLRSHVRAQILQRSREVCRRSIDVLNRWAARNRDRVVFYSPQGGGTCVVGLRRQGLAAGFVDDSEFVKRLIAEEKVFAPPAGICFGDTVDGSGYTELKGHLRIALGLDSEVLERGLEAIERLLKRWDE